MFATFDELSSTACVIAVKLPFTETSFINVLKPLIFWSDVVFTTLTVDTVNNFLSLGLLVEIDILSPATNVILSRPSAVKLPDTWPLTSQYLKVLFIPTLTTPVSSGFTENPASLSNLIVLIWE